MESVDIKFEIIKKIKTVEDLQKFCKLNRQNIEFCKNNSNIISKHILDKFKVDYTDPTNFIYVINKKNMDSYKDTDGKWKYKSLFKLYMTHYYKPEINCTDLGITSFPIYPNMKMFNGDNNRLTSFPVQPKMTDFWGSNNRLTSFPVQPKMEVFAADDNQLTSFPVQPEMFFFSGIDNQLGNYKCNNQPKIKICETHNYTIF